MKFRVLGGYGSVGVRQRPSAFLLNDRVLLDAGTVAGALTTAEQFDIEHALISHCHLDHTVGLAFLTEALACVDAPRPVTVNSVGPVVDSLRSSFFNNVVWPDFATIPPEAPVLAYHGMTADREQRVGDVWVTPVQVDHTVPTCGFIVRDDHTGLVYSGDTGPTTAIWQAARDLTGLAAVVLECSFPNRLGKIAEVSKHMTPQRIERELGKLPPDLPVWIFHIKSHFYEETAAELSRIDGAERLVLLEQGKTYTL
jgi:ribonuclease BN (tRNA processing enzyme)